MTTAEQASLNEIDDIPMLKRWKMAIDGCNVPNVERTDFISKWLVISRACVFSMTLTSGLIGVLLAAIHGSVNWWLAALCVVGLVASHAANNIINDWIDVRKGVDTEDYPRAQYSVHPLLGGLTTSKGLLTAFGLLTLFDGAIMIYLATVRGWLVVAFAVTGLALSITYTSLLKRYALGELTSLIVWGPLMIGGTAFVVAGELTTAMLLASLPYGLIVASVLVGKHIDKIEADKGVGVRSIPVLLGEQAALTLNKVFFVTFYVLVVGLVVTGSTGPWVLLTVFALPRLRASWKAYSEPKPAKPPEGWTVWPLWYVGWAMYFNRQAGSYFILGLVLNIATPYLVGLFT